MDLDFDSIDIKRVPPGDLDALTEVSRSLLEQPVEVANFPNSLREAGRILQKGGVNWVAPLRVDGQALGVGFFELKPRVDLDDPGAVAGMRDDFAARNCKIIGISVDGVRIMVFGENDREFERDRKFLCSMFVDWGSEAEFTALAELGIEGISVKTGAAPER